MRNPEAISGGSGINASTAGRRPRVVVVAESLPWPALKGGDLRTFQNVDALASFADVAVFGLCSNDSRRLNPPPLDLRFWNASTDPALTSPPPRGMRIDARAWLLKPDGHPSDIFFSDRAAAELTTLLAAFRPHVVLLEGLWMHRYVEVVRSSGCKVVILDCHNVESDLSEQVGKGDGRPDLEDRIVREVIPRRTAAIEGAALRRADQVWVCSEIDAAQFHARYPDHAPLVVIPNTLSLPDYPFRRERIPGGPIDPALTLVYPGFFAYYPNAVAARFIVGELFPALSDACGGSCRLTIVGAMPTDDLKNAALRDPRIRVTGTVQSILPYLQEATAMPVPLFQGSGTRLKVLQAFAIGVPVVSTSRGVEGLGVQPGEHVLCAETVGAFVQHLLHVWRDPSLASRLAARARSLLVERYSWQVVRPAIRRAVESQLGVEAMA